MCEVLMPVQSRLRVVVAETNVERVKQGQRPLTVRAIQDGTGLALSTIQAMMSNKAKGVQFETLEQLCAFFDVEPGALLERVRAAESEVQP